MPPADRGRRAGRVIKPSALLHTGADQAFFTGSLAGKVPVKY